MALSILFDNSRPEWGKKYANLLAIPSLKLVNLTQANLYTQTKCEFIEINNDHLKVI